MASPKTLCYVVLFAIISQLHKLNAQTNLLQNADFESTSFQGNWHCNGCNLSQSNDKHHGQHSAHIAGRVHNFDGLSQNVNVQAGVRYKITIFVKLLNTHNHTLYQTVEMLMACKALDGKDAYIKIGQTPYMQPGHWHEIGGALQVSSGYHGCRIYVQTDAPTDYLADDASLTLIPEDHDWKSKAQARIEHNRKVNVTLRLAGAVASTSSVDIELLQTEHDFIFGAAVDARKIVDHNMLAYQHAFYNNFEWATLENDFKWENMEVHQNQLNFNTPMTAVESLRSHGIKIRGHCVFWNVDRQVQNWIKNLDANTLKAVISKRVKDLFAHAKGLCEHWDVNNENLHGDFYERHTGDINITRHMFQLVREAESHSLLFLNEFNVISSSDTTVALKDTAMSYKNAGIPIGGVGVQGHIHTFDIHLIKARLDIVAEAGLPVVITEMGINEKNEDTRATKVTDVLTLLFSLPYMKGVIFWGFWNGSIWEHDAPLFSGSDVTANAAGRAYMHLFHNAWRTNITHTLHGQEAYHVRCFKGTYQLTVRHNGHVLMPETFTIADGGKDVEIHLKASSGGVPSISHVIVG